MSVFSSKSLEMFATAAHEARGRLEAIIGPLNPSDNLKAILPRIARRLGMSERRVRSFWARDARRIESHEMDRLRIEARRAEHLRTAGQLDEAAHALLALDHDGNSAEATRLRSAADQYRDLARAEGEG